MKKRNLFARGVKLLTVIVLYICLVPIISLAAPLKNVPQTLKQPDGTILKCFASGDEFYNWLHDENGYTIMKNTKGYYVYAIEENGLLKASDFIAGKDIPATKGLKPNARHSKEYIKKKREQYKVNRPGITLDNEKSSVHIQPLKAVATLNNIVVYIKFAGETPTAEPISIWESLFNNTTIPSLSTYYLEASYNQFTINSTFYPTPSSGNVVWYTDSNNRNYYKEYNATTNPIGYDPDIESSNYTDTKGKTYREHNLLKNAINSVASSIPSTLNIDSNNDGYVDCISFIITGYPEGWNDLIWPHRWSLWSITPDVTINSKIVSDYTFQMQYKNNTLARASLGVFAHEMFHIVGAPDLYHYDENSTISPVGPWDIMENTGNTPQHMMAYMKYMYGNWITSIPEISSTGTYTLSPLSSSSTQNCYRIPSPNTYKEFFMVEYRKKELYDLSAIPGDGLIVYRINTRLEGEGNADGPPNEVYVFRPGGTLTSNGTVNNAFFSQASGRTSINDSSDPYTFLSDGPYGGISIANIGAAGATIPFDVNINYTPAVVLRNDRGGLWTGIGNSTASTFTIASRYTAADVSTLVGRYLRKVEFYISSTTGTSIGVKVWKGGSYGNAGTLIYNKDISSQVQFKDWTTHTLDQPIQIEANNEYWIGYTISLGAKVYGLGVDRGPLKSGKGAWILNAGTWVQLKDLASSLDFNFMIRGVVYQNSTAINSDELNENINLSQNYPNPFNASTTFRFKINKPGHVRISVYNSIGQLVDIAADNDYESENNEVNYNGSKLSNGIYFYTLSYKEKGSIAAPFITTRKMSIIR
ncbi:MAG: M6 family metalloprotease domain-containing protein [Tenuifilaceae bacterium]